MMDVMKLVRAIGGDNMSTKYLMSIKEASEYFGIGRNRLYEMIRSQNDIPMVKVGVHLRINVPLFEQWLDNCSKEGRNL